MTVPGPARLIRLIGWLLLPVVAGAVSFLFAWIAVVIAGTRDWGLQGLYGLLAGGMLGAALGGGGWYFLMRAFSRRFCQDEDG